ncbi:MAG: hypothetical protein ACOYYS_12640 [Chloroflexota bacterium]
MPSPKHPDVVALIKTNLTKLQTLPTPLDTPPAAILLYCLRLNKQKQRSDLIVKSLARALVLGVKGENNMNAQKEFRVPVSVKASQTIGAYLMLGMGILVMFFSLVPYIAFSTSDPFYGFLLLLGALSLISPLLTLWILKETRIVTSPTQISFYSPSFELHSPWANLETIGSMPAHFGIRRFDSIVLQQPAEQKFSGLLGMFWKKPVKAIPLSMFGDWRESELGQEIKKYAPHLFV